MDTENMIISENTADSEKTAGGKKVRNILKWSVLFLLETVLLLIIALYGVMFVITKGPSPTAGRLFVRSVRETSAIGFLANIYYSADEIAAMESADEMEYELTDTDLIDMSAGENRGTEPDAWGFVDEDGDGIIIDKVKGEGYSGFMMIILDPSRVIVATSPSDYGGRGYTVEEYVKKFGAVAGINGGAFADPGGNGNGSMPEGLVAFEGKFYLHGVKQGFAGIDDRHILHVGCTSREDAEAANIQYGASYGPVLIQNGEMAAEEILASGLNPRTAIGQRSDGAFLFLVVDGRQVISLGCSYQDEAEIMLSYGAVNAVNLDGGSSSMMWYNDGYINNCASVIGIRPIPTAFIVMPQEN